MGAVRREGKETVSVDYFILVVFPTPIVWIFVTWTSITTNFDHG